MRGAAPAALTSQSYPGLGLRRRGATRLMRDTHCVTASIMTMIFFLASPIPFLSPKHSFGLYTDLYKVGFIHISHKNGEIFPSFFFLDCSSLQ